MKSQEVQAHLAVMVKALEWVRVYFALSSQPQPFLASLTFPLTPALPAPPAHHTLQQPNQTRPGYFPVSYSLVLAIHQSDHCIALLVPLFFLALSI